MAMATVFRFGEESRVRFNRKPASGWSAQSGITQEKVCVFPFSMAVKISAQTSTWIAALWQASAILVLVAGSFENNRARKAIAAIAYRHSGPWHKVTGVYCTVRNTATCAIGAGFLSRCW